MIVRRRLTETQRPAERRWVGEGDYSDVGEHRWVGAGNMLWRKDDSWLRAQNRNRETQREKTGMTLHTPPMTPGYGMTSLLLSLLFCCCVDSLECLLPFGVRAVGNVTQFCCHLKMYRPQHVLNMF